MTFKHKQGFDGLLELFDSAVCNWKLLPCEMLLFVILHAANAEENFY
jgi:hypothetical protein